MIVNFRNVSRNFVYGQLDELARYLDVSEKALQDGASEFRKRVEKQAKEFADQTQCDRLYAEYDDDYVEVSSTYSRVMRNALFVTLYSFLEHHVTNECTRLQKQKRSALGLEDLRGDLLGRVNLYFAHLTGKRLSGGSVWNDLRMYQALRNRKAHNGAIKGRSRESRDSALLRFVRKHELVDNYRWVASGKPVAVRSETCRDFIATQRLFFARLFDAIDGSQTE